MLKETLIYCRSMQEESEGGRERKQQGGEWREERDGKEEGWKRGKRRKQERELEERPSCSVLPLRSWSLICASIFISACHLLPSPTSVVGKEQTSLWSINYIRIFKINLCSPSRDDFVDLQKWGQEANCKWALQGSQTEWMRLQNQGAQNISRSS